TVENQLKETLAERAKIRNELAGSKSCNSRLVAEISALKQELQSLYNKANDNNILIDTLTRKHKHIQESIEAEKNIIQRNADRYNDELRKLKRNHEEDIKILDKLQFMVFERNRMILELQNDTTEGLKTYVGCEDEKTDFASEAEGKTESENVPEANAKSVDSKTVQSKTDVNNLEDNKESKEQDDNKRQSKIQKLSIECAKYKALLEAARMESDHIECIISMQESKMNEIAMQVIETERLIATKNIEKKELLEKLKNLQKAISAKKKKAKLYLPPQNRLEELRIKTDAHREENDFLRNFLRNTLKNRGADFVLYQKLVSNAKEYFINALQDVTNTLKQKNSPGSVDSNNIDTHEEFT
ncbi:uncharacterized protein LOC118180188, partial [Stegodyphus dumicola]|uniref:uncharacterized protein LOC118180188 n=1 Tax=Stegodyphus dumicola TaxID=202533 RepID=UPI0015AF1182